MTEEVKDNFREVGRSFRCAFRGFVHALSFERNFQIEIVCASFVVALIFIFKIKNWEAVILMVLTMWILVIELCNTVIEKIVDILKPRIHPYARLIKDMIAAVVLISAIFSAITGIIIFYPYFREVFFKG